MISKKFLVIWLSVIFVASLLELTQDSSGNRAITFGTGVEYGASFSSITLSYSPNLTDEIALVYRSASSKWLILGYVLGFA